LNVVDDPERSDFFFTAVYRDGDVTVSVSTEGASPALAQELRTMIAERLPDNLADVAQQLRRERADHHAKGSSTEASTGDLEFENYSARPNPRAEAA